MKNPNEEFLHYLECLKAKKTPKAKKNKIDCPQSELKNPKSFISLPENVIKPRIRSSILEILIEKLEKLGEKIISLNDISENPKIIELLQVEPNAQSFFKGCLEEIIRQKFMTFSSQVLEDLFVIEEKTFNDFSEFLKITLKGWFVFPEKLSLIIREKNNWS